MPAEKYDFKFACEHALILATIYCLDIRAKGDEVFIIQFRAFTVQYSICMIPDCKLIRSMHYGTFTIRQILSVIKMTHIFSHIIKIKCAPGDSKMKTLYVYVYVCASYKVHRMLNHLLQCIYVHLYKSN